MISNYFGDRDLGNQVSENGVNFVEIGPGRQLKAMLKRIDKIAYKKCENITV